MSQNPILSHKSQFCNTEVHSVSQISFLLTMSHKSAELCFSKVTVVERNELIEFCPDKNQFCGRKDFCQQKLICPDKNIL